MIPKEVITAAIKFNNPSCVPYETGIPGREYFDNPGTDEQWVRISELAARLPHYTMGFWPRGNWKDAGTDESGQQISEDEWGVRWVDTHKTSRVVSHPLLHGIPGDYMPPPLPPAEEMHEFRERADANRDKYIVGYVWFTLFEHLWFLRGYEQTLIELYEQSADLDRLLNIIFERALACVRQWREVGVDGIFFSDDWGSQRGLIINPTLWREIFKPFYKQLFDEVHAQGAHVWMHMCGNVLEILPDMIDIGLNVLNPVQPRAMDIATLAERHGGKLCFNGGIDVQGTLVWGSPQDVRDEVKRTIETLGAFKGGYIGATSHTIMPETPVANLIAMLEAFEEYAKTSPM
jgi:uroporphyrinogen decarboxylase